MECVPVLPLSHLVLPPKQLDCSYRTYSLGCYPMQSFLVMESEHLRESENKNLNTSILLDYPLKPILRFISPIEYATISTNWLL